MPSAILFGVSFSSHCPLLLPLPLRCGLILFVLFRLPLPFRIMLLCLISLLLLHGVLPQFLRLFTSVMYSLLRIMGLVWVLLLLQAQLLISIGVFYFNYLVTFLVFLIICAVPVGGPCGKFHLPPNVCHRPGPWLPVLQSSRIALLIRCDHGDFFKPPCHVGRCPG